MNGFLDPVQLQQHFENEHSIRPHLQLPTHRMEQEKKNDGIRLNYKERWTNLVKMY